MSEAAMLERQRTLIRFEHAAGAAFGHEDEPAGKPVRLFSTPATIALATLATAVAATLHYLV